MKYFIVNNNIQQGPFTIDELRLRGITSDTLVWTEGMAQWMPAWQVEELRPLFYGRAQAPGPAAPPPPPPLNPAETRGGDPLPPNVAAAESLPKDGGLAKPRQGRRHGGVWAAVIAALLLVFLGITNPSKDEHREAIRERMTRGIAQAVASQGDDLLSQGFGIIGHLLAGPLINAALDDMVEYHNYLFFSTTSIKTRDGDITTSYGLVGRVFTINEERIAAIISSAMEKGSHGQGTIVPNDDQPIDSGDEFIDDAVRFIKGR